jgi:16S rRNA (uracil1498-N3)-methyltransferase
MDIIVRQATELGVASITPVRSTRALGDPSPNQVSRWTRIAGEALQQCGRRQPPAIHAPVDLKAVATMALGGGACSLFFHEDREASESLHRLLSGAPGTVRVLVGPEGGLSAEEAAGLFDAGWRQAWLGPTVLRCETAAAAAVSAVTIVLLESDTWKPRVTERPTFSASPSTA